MCIRPLIETETRGMVLSSERRKSILHYYVGNIGMANRVLRQSEAAVGDYDVTIVYRCEKEEKQHRANDRFKVIFEKKTRPRPNVSPIWKAPRFLFNELRLFWRLLRQKADIFHPHQHSSLPVASLWVLFTKKPVVFDPHDMNMHDENRRGVLPTVQRWLERLVIRRAGAVLVVSEGMREFYERKYAGTPVYLLPNLPARTGARMPPTEDVEDQEERSGAASGPVRLVYAGLINTDRLPMEVVRAIGRCEKRVALDILGFSQTGYDDNIRRCIYEESFKNIFLRGRYSESDIVSHLRAYDYFILPYCIQNENILHCMPNKVYQALAAGLPLIASGLIEVGNLIRSNGIGYVFEDGDYDTLANLLGRLDTSSREYLEQRSRVREVARKVLDYEAYHSELMSAYAAALRSRRKGRADGAIAVAGE